MHVQFDASVEPLVWGRNTYTIIKVPDRLAARAREQATRRVGGDIEGCAVNLGLNRADVISETFVYLGDGLRTRLAVHRGDVVRCQLAPADPHLVPLPDDVRDALDAACRLRTFEDLPASERRRALGDVERAIRAETRARRVAALVASVMPD